MTDPRWLAYRAHLYRLLNDASQNPRPTVAEAERRAIEATQETR